MTDAEAPEDTGGFMGWGTTNRTLLAAVLATLMLFVLSSCGSTPTYTVGGTAGGLSGTVVLQNNNGNTSTLTTNGSFKFSTSLKNGTTYNVTVLNQPAGQTCTVVNGSGIIGNADVTNVQVACTNIPYTVGGTVSGLNGTAVLQNNGGDDLTLSANGSFTFSSTLLHATAYIVAVSHQPAGQICAVTGGAGTINAADVINIQVACTDAYAVGGTVSGLNGTTVLQNNGGDDLTLSANGSFTFNNIVSNGTAYGVTVLTQPVGQDCTVANGSGTISGAGIDSVQVACTNIPYTVGGTVSGLLGDTFTLQNNGGDDLIVNSNGSFVFSTSLLNGEDYGVAVSVQPAGETCTVKDGSGTMHAADVDNVQVTCVDSVAPSAAIAFPPAVSMTQGDTVTVYGTASDNGTITAVRVNGVEVQTSDDYATWEVAVPLAQGTNTLTVETEDAASNADQDAAEAIIAREDYFGMPVSIDIDSANDRALVLDKYFKSIVAVDLFTGTRTVLSDSTTPDTNNQFSLIIDLAVDSANNRALAIDYDHESIVAVDLLTGARTVLSDNVTPNASNPFTDPSCLAIDSKYNRALVLDSGAVIAVDLDTGARTILSDDTTPDAGNPFGVPTDMVVDSLNNRALITDQSLKAVIAVDLVTGARTVLSDNSTPNGGNPFSVPVNIAIDSANNRALVSSQGLNSAVIAVDLDTGARTILSDSATPDADTPFAQPGGIAVDSIENRAMILDPGRNILMAVNLATGSRTIFLEDTTPDSSYPLTYLSDVTIDGAHNRALVVDNWYNAILAVNLATGSRTILSNTGNPDINYPFVTPKKIVIDSINDRALVTDLNRHGIIAINLSTGARTILSDNSTPNGDNPFIFPGDIAIDSANNRALVIDPFLNGVIAVDLSTGARTILSDDTTPNDINPFINPGSIAVDNDNNQALVTDTSLNAIFAVDLLTGARTVFSNSTTPDASNPFPNLDGGIAIDSANNRAMVLTGANGMVMGVDLSTGARTILFDNTTPDTNNPIGGLDFAIDSANNRILEADFVIDALLAIHPESGERVILSK